MLTLLQLLYEMHADFVAATVRDPEGHPAQPGDRHVGQRERGRWPRSPRELLRLPQADAVAS